MASCSRLLSIGMTVVLIGFVLAAALPVSAQATTIGIAVAVEPDAPYFGAPANFTITLEVSGGTLSEVAVQIEHDCNTANGPIEVIGNGDDILEPGEQWEYMCHTDLVFHGVLHVTVSGVDGVAGDVSEFFRFDYGASFPFVVEVATSALEVYEGEDVTWDVLVGNDGPYAIVDIHAEPRLNGSGPYSSMAGPVEKNGNSDDVLDPGEFWEYHWSAVLWHDSFVEISYGGAPEHSPGTGFGSQVASDAVTVISGPRPAEAADGGGTTTTTAGGEDTTTTTVAAPTAVDTGSPVDSGPNVALLGAAAFLVLLAGGALVLRLTANRPS
jgi:hypothetical protein